MNQLALIFSKDRADTVGVYVERALKKLNIPFDHYNSTEMGKIPPLYDVYFRVADAHCEQELPVHLKKSVYWISDVHLQAPLKHFKKQVSNYDHVFCFTQLGLQKIKKYSNKPSFLSFACDKDLHGKKKVSKKYDLGYVGTDGGFPRKIILQELRERYPNSYIGHADYQKMADIYSAAKIGFNFPISLEGFNMRSFEICAAGTLQIMPRLNRKWARDLGFKDKKNIVFFDDMKDLIALIDFYLVHEKQREKIAKEGYELVMKHHTYEHKVKEALGVMRHKLGVNI